MRPFCRIYLACLLLVGGLAAQADEANTLPALQAQKESAVRACMDRSTAAPTQAAIRDAASRAQALTALAFHGSPGQAVVTFSATAAPEYKILAMDEGRRLIVDLKNTINLRGNRKLSFEGLPFLLDVRDSLFSVSPECITRVVLILDRPCGYEVERYAGSIVLRLSEARGEESLSLDNLVDQLNAVRSQQETPDAETIEITRLTESLRAVSDPALDLSTARPAAYAADAQPVAPGTAPAPAEAQPAAGQPAAPAPESEEAKRLREAGLLPPLPQQPPAPPAAPPAGPEGQPPAAPAETTPAAEPPAPREDAKPDTREANTAIASKIEQIESGQTPDGAKALTSAESGGAEPKVYTGDPLQQLVNVDFREMELANVVALLAHKAGINVIAGADLAGTVTAKLTRVPLMQAMQTALRMNGLGMIEEEGIYRIVLYEESVAAQRQSVLVTLQNAKAEDLEKVLKDMVAGTKDQRLVTVSSNKPANILVITGPQSKTDNLVRLAHELDVAEPPLISNAKF